MKLHRCILMGPLHHSGMTSRITTQTCLLTTFAGGVGKTALTDSLHSVVSVACRASHRCWQTQCVYVWKVQLLLQANGPARENRLQCKLNAVYVDLLVLLFKKWIQKGQAYAVLFFACSQYSIAHCARITFAPNRKSHLGRRSSLTLPHDTFRDILMGCAPCKHATSLLNLQHL